MINFRKLKQDLSPTILKEGQALYKNGNVQSVKIDSLSGDAVGLSCSVAGNFDNFYTVQLEVDRSESSLIDSDCDCPYKYDCQHLAGVLYHLEDHLDQILVAYSKENDPSEIENLEEDEKEEILGVLKEAEHKEVIRQGKKYEKELIQEYTSAAAVLACSPFFVNEENSVIEKADLIIIFSLPEKKGVDEVCLRLAIRVPYRSKPLYVPSPKAFLDSVRYSEPLYIGSKRFNFAMSSFPIESAQLLKMTIDFARFPKVEEEGLASAFFMSLEDFGAMLAHSYDLLASAKTALFDSESKEQELIEMPCFSCGSLEEPLRVSPFPAQLTVELSFLEAPAPKVFLKPLLVLGDEQIIEAKEATLLESQKPGILYSNIYYRFQPKIKRKHLRHLTAFQDLVIPEPLFGTFVENGMPELMRLASVQNSEVIEQFATMPFTGELTAICDIQYLDGELDATVRFVYGKIQVPSSHTHVKASHITPFVTKEGILARNLTEEERLLQDLFQGFTFDDKNGTFAAKNDKKIVEFMTEIVPKFAKRVKFNCPKNLLDKFIYDDTSFTLHLKESDVIDKYIVELKVDGNLKGLTVDLLWDCLATKRTFIELKKKKTKGSEEVGQVQKVLVLDLDRLAPVVQIFDEIGLTKIDNHSEERPLWSLVSISEESFEGLPIKFTISKKLKEIKRQMLGEVEIVKSAVPKEVKATLHSYQLEGVGWLERLRHMHLAGILADDMGLGKTIQAICAIAQYRKEKPESISLIVCPTSLVYNWKEEFHKFYPGLKTLVVDGIPQQRKKLIAAGKDYDVLITSYSLMQKDIEQYQEINFGYMILDEAQNIKNRGTRNAKSVKMLRGEHRLILSGTPIENSLEELWSLFDYLMPGLLSTFERFNEKFVRSSAFNDGRNLDLLRTKVSPFILRRMKKDVLSELPPVSHLVYHCHLSEVQRELYRAYADSARKELSELVEKEGFNKVQIQILATLTRLKQICCHPAIFAKEKAEIGDSAKYDLMLEILSGLIESKRKVVIFSQYTRMLQIMKRDFENRGIKFSYLDGATKDRMEIVNEFNRDPTILVFLVSLKAGGTGLNLVGADTVIHYDPWWNPAAEDQATDRVHRIGQTKNVSAYKLVTLGTIEEKIQEMQNRKRGLVKKVISSDEEALSKLTWDEVLELLKT